MRWSSAAGRPPTANSARCWSASIAAIISSMSAASAPAIGAGQGAAAACRALKAAAADKSPVQRQGCADEGRRDMHWLKPELVAEIEFAGWTGDGKIRQAAFKGLRAGQAGRRGRSGEAVACPRRVASPIRPAARARKSTSASAKLRRGHGRAHLEARQAAVAGRRRRQAGDQARSRRAISRRSALDDRHLKGRPCSIIRAPDGIGGEQFFQRHAMPGTSNLLELVKVSGDRKPYLQIDRVEGLAAVAQIGGLELHPWNCAARRARRAGPAGVRSRSRRRSVDFADVIEAAKEMRERLTASALSASARPPAARACMW